MSDSKLSIEAMRWVRHRDNCRVGSHCEDPFCHHRGECTCGLDAWLVAIGTAVGVLMADEDAPRE